MSSSRSLPISSFPRPGARDLFQGKRGWAEVIVTIKSFLLCHTKTSSSLVVLPNFWRDSEVQQNLSTLMWPQRKHATDLWVMFACLYEHVHWFVPVAANSLNAKKKLHLHEHATSVVALWEKRQLWFVVSTQLRGWAADERITRLPSCAHKMSYYTIIHLRKFLTVWVGEGGARACNLIL